MRELKNISASEKSIPIVFTSMINNKKYDLSFNHDITYSISQTPQVYIECKENEKIQAFENYKEEFKKKFIKGISAPRFDLAVTKIEHNNYYLMVWFGYGCF
ncbi:MAG: hypothetical protein E7214_05855 [Clostridium sp.]|nr:hypothetical protein [Clostridium sp.]